MRGGGIVGAGFINGSPPVGWMQEGWVEGMVRGGWSRHATVFGKALLDYFDQGRKGTTIILWCGADR